MQRKEGSHIISDAGAQEDDAVGEEVLVHVNVVLHSNALSFLLSTGTKWGRME